MNAAPTKKLPPAKEPQQERQFSTKTKVALQLLVLLVGSAMLVYATAAQDKQLEKLLPESYTNRSINNFKPSGMSACFELLKQVFSNESAKRKVGTWEFSYRELRGSRRPIPILKKSGHHFASDEKEKEKEISAESSAEEEPIEAPAADAAHGVLIIASPEESLSDFDVEDVLTWVRQGNYLVFLDSFPYPSSRRLLSQSGINVKDLEPAADNRQSDPNFKADVYAHLRTLKLSAGQSLRGGTALATVDGVVIIAEKAVGKGKILISSCAGLVDNRHISNSESWSNFQFLYNWLNTTDGDILFDERCHGASQARSVYFYFLRGPAGLFIAQLLLILIIAVASGHQRFGRLLGIKDQRRISNLEHINGMANTYARASATQAVLEIIWSSVRQKICRILQISPHESSEKLLEELKLRGETTREIVNCLNECETAIADKKGHIGEEKLRELVGACDKISQKAENSLLAPSISPNDLTNISEAINKD